MEINEGSPGQFEESGSGTTFTVNLGDVELTDEETNAIMSEITRSALERARSDLPPDARIFGRFGRFGKFSRHV